jgi:hypothetical protein
MCIFFPFSTSVCLLKRSNNLRVCIVMCIFSPFSDPKFLRKIEKLCWYKNLVQIRINTEDQATWTSLLTNEKVKSTYTRQLLRPNRPQTWALIMSCISICWTFSYNRLTQAQLILNLLKYVTLLCVLFMMTNFKWPPQYSWNIVESDVNTITLTWPISLLIMNEMKILTSWGW